jgi:hypothetical protein
LHQLLACFLTLFSSLLFAADNVIPGEGKTFIYKASYTAPKRVATTTELNRGDLIATGKKSSAIIDFQGNGLMALSPNTIVVIRGINPQGIRLVSLQRGQVIFQVKPEWKNRSPGVVTHLKNSSRGFIGKAYSLSFTKDEKKLRVLGGKVYQTKISADQFSLTNLADALNVKRPAPRLESDADADEGEEDDEEDEDEDEEDEDEEDKTSDESLSSESVGSKNLSTYHSLLREKLTTEKEELTIDDKQDSPLQMKLFLRGVKYEQNFNNILRSNDGIFDNRNDLDAFEEHNYDARLEFLWDKTFNDFQFNFHGWLEYGNRSENYRGPLQIFSKQEEGRGIIEINEAYLQHSLQNSDITAGKKVFKTGFSTLFSPMDRVTPKDNYDPLDTKDLGNFVIQYDKYIGNSTFTYAVLPFFSPIKQPGVIKRENTNQTSTQNSFTINVNYQDQVSKETPSGNIQNFNHYLQFKTTFWGIDLIAAAQYGYSQFPVYREEYRDTVDFSSFSMDIDISTFEEYIKVLNTSVGFTTNIFRFNVYAEFLQQKADDGKDDDFLASVYGIYYKMTDWSSLLFMNEINYRLEYAQEKINKRQSAADYTLSSIENRPYKSDLLGRIEFIYSDDLKFTYNFDYELAIRGKSVVYGIEYKLTPDVLLKTNYEVFDLNNSVDSSTTRDTSIGPVTLNNNVDISGIYKRYTLKLEANF